MMQTIGYQDMGDPRRNIIHCYTDPTMTRGERFTAALRDMRGLGHVRIYRVQLSDKGEIQRYRLISKRRW